MTEHIHGYSAYEIKVFLSIRVPDFYALPFRKTMGNGCKSASNNDLRLQ